MDWETTSAAAVPGLAPHPLAARAQRLSAPPPPPPPPAPAAPAAGFQVGDAALAAMLRQQHDGAPAPAHARVWRGGATPPPPLLFQLVACACEEDLGLVVLRGRTADGRSVALSCTGYLWRFFVQRHAPFADDAERARFLVRLLLAARSARATLTVPKAKDPAKSSTRNVAAALRKNGGARVQLARWRPADGQHRTMFGWTPPDERLANLIELSVADPRVVRLLCDLVDSTHYYAACPQDVPVRTFEGQVLDAAHQFRLDAGITMGGWVRVHDYDPEREPLLYADASYTCSWRALAAAPECIDDAPLRTLSFDIECANATDRARGAPAPVPHAAPDLRPARAAPDAGDPMAVDGAPDGDGDDGDGDGDDEGGEDDEGADTGRPNRFPVPRWGPIALREFLKGRCGVPQRELPAPKSLSYANFGRMRAWAAQYEAQHPGCGLLARLPPADDTDPCFLVVAVERVQDVSRDLHFSRARAILLRHPRQAAPVDRGAHVLDPAAAAAAPRSFVAQYGALELVEVADELALWRQLELLVHTWRPDRLVGWNIVSFDLPYAFERWEALHDAMPNAPPRANRYGQAGRRDARPTRRSINLGLRVGGESRAFYKKKESQAMGQRFYLAVSTPYVDQIDGLVVWEAEEKCASYALDAVAEANLAYPPESLRAGAAAEDALRAAAADAAPGGPARTTFPRRKLQVDVTRGGEFWQAGGARLWLFVCYCYADACLPVHLLEEKGKFAYASALARIANIPFEMVVPPPPAPCVSRSPLTPCQVFGGQQRKVAGAMAGVARTFGAAPGAARGPYLMPDYGARHLHWPDAWACAAPADAAAFFRASPRFARIPDGLKKYMGAAVLDPHRGFHQDPIGTLDFVSLYPMLALAYRLSYMNFLTRAAIARYQVPRHAYVRTILGPADVVFCGEAVRDAAAQADDDYHTAELKEAHWFGAKDTILARTMQMFFAKRKEFKAQKARWRWCARALELAERAPAGGPPPALTRAEAAALEEHLEGAAAVAAARAALASPAAWAAAVHEARAATGGLEAGAAVALARRRAQNADVAQIVCKIVLNSVYGFTGAKFGAGKLPLNEIAAAITALGRHVLFRTRNLVEAHSVAGLRAAVAQRDALAAARFGGDRARALAHVAALDLDLDAEAAACLHCARALLALPAAALPPPGSVAPDACLHVHAGDTDSVMAGVPRAFLRADEDVPEVIEMMRVATAHVNARMLPPMSLEQEKVALQSVFNMKKNYTMDVFGHAKILYKGHEAAKRDTLPFVAKTLDRMFRAILRPAGAGAAAAARVVREPRAATVARIRGEVERVRAALGALARGEYDLSEFALAKKLSKIEYNNALPEHVVVANKIRARGGNVQVGQRIRYGYVAPAATDELEGRVRRARGAKYLKSRGAEVVEDLQHIIAHNLPLNMEHYMRQKMKGLPRLLRHILSPVSDYPHEDAYGHDAARLEKDQKKIAAFQDARVAAYLLAHADREFAKQHAARYADAVQGVDTRKRSLRDMLFGLETVACALCGDRFEAARPHAPALLCAPCAAARPATEARAHALIAEGAATRAASDATCATCIGATGFAHLIDAADCTKYGCEVYQAREAAGVREKRARHQLAALAQAAPPPPPPAPAPAPPPARPAKRPHVAVEYDPRV